MKHEILVLHFGAQCPWHQMTSKPMDRLRATGNSLMVENGDRLIFASAEKGLRPLVECIVRHKTEMAGARVIDKIVGAAAAKLLVYAEVAEVYAAIASRKAKEILEANKITFSAESIVPYIMGRDKRGPCPMETLSTQFADGEELFLELRKRFKV